jgi:hypothetical protein
MPEVAHQHETAEQRGVQCYDHDFRRKKMESFLKTSVMFLFVNTAF